MRDPASRETGFWHVVGGRAWFVAGSLLLFLILVAASPSFANEDEPLLFLGQEITGVRTSYVVTRDVNVRAKPETGSKRVSGLKKGQQVVSPGRYQGWIAIENDGEPYGFAYFKYLLPFVDGALREDITGNMTVGPRACDYTIAFAGKNKPDGEAFDFADYNVSVRCKEGPKELAFDLFAFMSEGPYARGKDTVHQIGIDLLAIAEDYDRVLSTIILFDHEKQQIAFDQVTLPDYAQKPPVTQAEAEDVASAVEEAVRMTLAAWNDKVWEELSQARS